MAKIETLEKEIVGLSPQEPQAFRRWFAEFDAELRHQERNLEILKSDPRHPSLRFKQIGRIRASRSLSRT